MKNEEANFQPLRSTAQKDLESDASSIWNICPRFSESTSGGITEYWLFSQVTIFLFRKHYLKQ